MYITENVYWKSNLWESGSADDMKEENGGGNENIFCFSFVAIFAIWKKMQLHYRSLPIFFIVITPQTIKSR